MIPQANIIITHRCNLLCKHCYMNANNKQKEDEDLIKEDVFGIIDKLSELNTNKIMITGGECTLNKYLLDILKYIKSKNIKTSIFTNGFIYKKEILDYVDDYCLSVDGNKEFHNYIRGNDKSYDNVIFTLKELISNKKQVSVQMTILDDNINELEDNLIYLYKLGIKKVNLCCLLKQGRSCDNDLRYNKTDKLNEIINEVYKKTGYNMYIHTNLYSKYDIDTYLKNGIINFPLWIDIISNKFYYVDEKFSNSINELEIEKIDLIKNRLYKNILKINNNSMAILEDELINEVGLE